MDDPLLARARALVAAAATVPDVHSASSSFSPAQQSPDGSPAPSPPRRNRAGAVDDGSFTKFRCSVFKGSSLVTVLNGSGEGGDIRAVVQKGMTVVIDGQEHTVSRKQFAEWTANRFELAVDYPGETNFDACLSVRNAARRSPKKKSDAQPIGTEDIRGAISGLDSIVNTFSQGRGADDNSSIRPLRKAQASKAMNLTERKRPTPTMHEAPANAFASPQRASEIRSRISEEDAQPRHRPMPMAKAEPSSSFQSAESDDGSSASGMGMGMGMDGGTGYMSQLAAAREVSMETQRKNAYLRVMRKKKEDEMESVKAKKAADELKEAHRAAMEIKAQQLREKTLHRVAALNLKKIENEESKRAQDTFELSKKLESASVTQTETYKQRMLRMRKDTAKRLRQIRLEEEERDHAQKVQMNKKLSEIAEARRRVDRDAPMGYVPPVHTHVVRRTRTASPRSSARAGSAGDGGGGRSSFAASQDDGPLVMALSPQHGKGYTHNAARAPSPVVVSNEPRDHSFSPQEQRFSSGGEYRHVSSNASHSRIPVPSARRGAPSGRADDEDDLSDDSLGGPPPLPSPKRAQVSSSYDEDLSVLTFDSPSRPRQQKKPASMNVDGPAMRRAPPRKKVWKTLKPLQIGAYSAVPHAEALKEA